LPNNSGFWQLIPDNKKSLHSPQRRHHPPDLAWLGIHDFREIHCKPYRIIYEIMDTDIMIHAVIDGRRDIRDFLVARLLR
jgi:toxin ParE1/3/4